MPKFRVTLKGKNFPVIWEGETQLFGFMATRKVKAENPEAAEIAAIQLIKEDPELIAIIDPAEPSDPQLYLDDIQQLSWWHSLGGKGYTFFPMAEL